MGCHLKGNSPEIPQGIKAITDKAIDLSGLTLDELVYDEVKRNYALRQFDQRAARKILDGVCQSVGLQLPWLEVDGESYIPTEAVAEFYGVERDSVNVTYNRKPALFAPITKRFDGEDLVCLKSRVLSLSVIESDSITLRERWSEALDMTRHVIGFTELAVLGLSNISETPRAKIVKRKASPTAPEPAARTPAGTSYPPAHHGEPCTVAVPERRQEIPAYKMRSRSPYPLPYHAAP